MGLAAIAALGVALACSADRTSTPTSGPAPDTVLVAAERAPEVKWVRDAMDETGVDLCLDVHGDEALPYNFIAGSEGIPDWTPRLAELLQRFRAAYQRANPDFQTRFGYPVSAAGQANLTMCTSQVWPSASAASP